MDVLLVTAVVSGGVGRHVQHLARGLDDRGHRVVVACPAAVDRQFRFGEHGARVVRVEIGSGRLPVPSPPTLRRLGQVMAGADVTHAHGMRAGAVAALARGGPLVVTSHNAPPPGPSGVVYRVLEQVVCRRADVVLGVSPDLVTRARACGARDVDLAVVPAGHTPVLSEQDRHRARHSVRSELGLPVDGGPPVIISAGRLGRQKRTGLLVDAYHLLLRGRTVAPVLVIAGDGPEQEQLTRQAAEGPGDVRLLGHREDVPTLLAGADVAVSAAAWEGQPLFLQEALAAGLPVVATDVGGTGVVLGGAGVLVAGDGAVAEELAATLAGVLDDPGRAAALRRRSLARAAELPGPEDAVTAALAVYERLLSHP